MICKELSLRGASLCLLALLPAGPCAAFELNLGLGYDREYSSNIHRVPVNAESESINVTRALFSMTETSAQTDLRVAGEYAYYDYVDNLFRDDGFLRLSSAAVWVLQPQRFNWTFEDYFSQEVIDLRAPVTQRNVENRNVLSTGPDWIFRTGALSSVELRARYGNSYYEATERDDDRLFGGLAWLYQYSSYTTMSANYDMTVVEYADEDLNTNYRQADLYYRTRVRSAPSEYTIDVGTSTISREGEEDTTDVLARLDWRRSRTSTSGFALAARGQFSDQSQDLLRRGGLPDIGEAGTSGQGEFYYTTGVEFLYTQARRRGSDQFRLFWEDVDYRDAPLDRSLYGGAIEFVPLALARIAPLLFGGYTETRFVADGREDVDSYVGLRIGYQARPTIAVRLEVRESRRESTDPEAEYAETRAILGFVYSRNPNSPFNP